ncbi:MAG: hypothetical protein Alpg2KO_14080 [Alphaproteobacteria bacterium]
MSILTRPQADALTQTPMASRPSQPHPAQPIAQFDGRTCVIRQKGKFSLVLGAWGHLFGAWMLDPNAQWNSHEILPALSPLELASAPLRLIDGPSASLLPDLSRLTCCADSRAALDDWAATIPAPLLAMAGRFGRLAWQVLDLLAHAPELEVMVSQDLNRNGGHLTAALLALQPADRRHRAGRADLARALKRNAPALTLTALIPAETSDLDAGHILLDALKRIESESQLHPRDYRLLARLVASPARCRVLKLASVVDARLIKLLGWAPEDKVSPALLTAWRNGAPLSQLAASLAPEVAPVVEHREAVYA